MGKPYAETREFGVWSVLGFFALGAAIGAGAAVFLAPESGEQTRRRVGRRVRKLTRRERSTWERLRRTLEHGLEERRVERRAREMAAADPAAG